MASSLSRCIADNDDIMFSEARIFLSDLRLLSMQIIHGLILLDVGRIIQPA